MIEIFPWTQYLETGIRKIDEQHRKLVDLLNELARQYVEGTNHDAVLRVLGELADYADYHFTTEEAIWHASLSMAQVANHEESHRRFLSKIHVLQAGDSNLHAMHEELFAFLTEWLAFHILDSDRRLAWVVLGMEQGLSEAEAVECAEVKKRGAEGSLSQAIMSLYRRMIAETLNLMRERHARLRAERSLHRQQVNTIQQTSSERLRNFMDQLPVGVLVADLASGCFLTANPLFESMLGYNTDELRNLSRRDIHPVEDHARVEHEFARMARGEVRSVSNMPVLRKDGSRFMADIHGIRLDIDGRSTLLSLYSDVTEKLWLRDDLLRAQAVARIGSWKLDLKTQKLDWSPETYRLFGIPEGTPLMLKDFLESVHPADRARVEAAWRAALQGAPYDIEHRTARGDPVVWVRGRAEFGGWIDGQATLAFGTVQEVTEQKQQEERLEYIAYRDVLTGMLNRFSFVKTLQEAMSRADTESERFILCYIDIDDLGRINDSMGEAAGDRTLITVSRRLIDVLSDQPPIARIGGDQFAVILRDVKGDDSCLAQVNAMLRVIATPIEIGSDRVGVTASIGITRYPQNDKLQDEQLMRQAYQAMYHAKVQGKNRYRMFDKQAYESDRSRHALIDELRAALHGDEFRLYYQPKVNLITGEIVGFEALIRWQHPVRGLISPDQFIHVLEQHPLVVPVGHWILDTALDQLVAWNKSGLTTRVSVNVASLQLEDPEFVAKLARQVSAKPDIDPDRLEIEILETGLLNDLDRVAAVISNLTELGISCALDDFGTGYASLMFLKRLKTRTIKIDQGFVRGMLNDEEHLAIVRATLELGRTFNRQVLAEGVETDTHARRLIKLGCELAQGYAIARPMPAEDIMPWVGNWQRPDSWGQAVSTGREVSP